MIYIREQMKLHPSMTAQDIIKMCYQAAFGAEHILSDIEAALNYFESEYNTVPSTDEPLYEMISEKVCRINMGAWKKEGMPSSWLFQMFTMSASIYNDGGKAFAEYAEKAAQIVPNFRAYLDKYLKSEVRPVHHSDCYRKAEQPHYRVVSSKIIRIIPLLKRIYSTNAKVISIDGRAASGKTTLSSYLSYITGASVVHMDDFFLPPALRTEERLQEAGGNIHYERFIEEVLPEIRKGNEFTYTAFDCSVMDYGEKRTVHPSPYIIVEGAYSCHPLFGDYTDIKVFSDISPEDQMKRILLRNGEKMAEMFASRWIPMEEKYYKVFRIKEKADLILD